MPHPVDGPPTELLVLGSAHLNAETTDAALQPTLERLLAWRPQAVAVEVLPGDVIQSYRLEGELYADLRVSGFPEALRLETQARKHRTWGRAEAEALALHPATPPSERVLAWLVALETVNALLAWTPDLLLPPDMADSMTAYAAWTGEIQPLARRLGHIRLHHCDDFTANTALRDRLKVLPELWKDEAFMAGIHSSPAIMEGGERLQRANAAEDY